LGKLERQRRPTVLVTPTPSMELAFVVVVAAFMDFPFATSATTTASFTSGCIRPAAQLSFNIAAVQAALVAGASLLAVRSVAIIATSRGA